MREGPGQNSPWWFHLTFTKQTLGELWGQWIKASPKAWPVLLLIHTRVYVHVLVCVSVCRCVFTHFVDTPAPRRETAHKYVPLAPKHVMLASFLLCVHKDRWCTWSLSHTLSHLQAGRHPVRYHFHYGKFSLLPHVYPSVISSVGKMLCECGKLSGFPHLCARGFQYLPWPPHSRPWAQTNNSIVRTRKIYSTIHI